jgi:preprotein translocase subunit SecG
MTKPRTGGQVMRNAKSLTAVFGSFLLALTLTAGMAVAQSGSADSPKDSSSQPAQQSQPDQSQPSAPGQAAPDMKQPQQSDTRSDFRSESRSERVVETERTKMLGMDPMVAMIVGAVLFIVVIMAIVAMSKRSSTSVETRRTI